MHSIYFYTTYIREKTSEIISQIGQGLNKLKKRIQEARYNRALAKYNFKFCPVDVADQIIVINGVIYRVQFTKDGFILRDELTDWPIDAEENKLLTLQIFKILSEK